VPLRVLLEGASPLDWLWQWCCVGNVAALSELNNLPFSVLLFDYRECCVREVQVAFDAGLETTGPPDHVHEATFVAIYVGHTKGVNGAMLERRKGHAQCRVEDCIEPP